MKRYLPLVLLFAVPLWMWGVAKPDPADSRREAAKLMKAGNFAEAAVLYKALSLDANTPDSLAAKDVYQAQMCIQRLNRWDEIDAFSEAVAEVHADDWETLQALAQSWLSRAHHGVIVGGEFKRGNHRGGRAKWVQAQERDRVRALQLYWQAIAVAQEADVGGSPAANLYQNAARAVVQGRQHRQSWQLQVLTDIETLPDYEDGRYSRGGGVQGAPTDADGKAIYYAVPKTLAEAKNDGERWRWMLARSATMEPSRKWQVKMEYARFLQQQFGVQSMQQHLGGWWRRQATNEEDANDSILTVDTLKDSETIARLAVGIKRFELPNEHNFIALFNEIADGEGGSLADQALQSLASIFENRRQYPKAAEMWRRSIREHGKSSQKTDRLAQIVDNWGAFEPGKPQPPSSEVELRYRFRNGKNIELTATEIDVKTLVADVKDYLRSNPKRLEHEEMNIDQIGYRLVKGDAKKYLVGKAQEWEQALKPRDNHFDRLVDVKVPFSKAGAWFVEAKMDDGNASRIIVWLTDTVIVRKPLENKMLYFVADAKTGAPLAKAKVDLFGFRNEYHNNRKLPGARRMTVHVKESTMEADEDGLCYVGESEQPRNHQWLVTATAGDRLAHLGFSGIWYNRKHDATYKRTRGLIITDRPIYRPGQSMDFKAWVRHAQYDMGLDESRFAGKSFEMKIHNPKGEEVFKKSFKADEFGGMADTWPIPEDATLGVWRIQIQGVESMSFRVEEYKKPEYEVVVTPPSKPVMLGEEIEATIQADYFFGAPVSNAKVKYKVLRYTHDTNWYPSDSWDWMYDTGYWWWGYNYHWYPGWARWGCERPMPWWRPFNPAPPEVVAEVETEIGKDGKLVVKIDTATAKAMHGNKDHRYEVTAEVTDQSRRTIVGKGSVVVARAPFRIFAWMDRGHYRTNDVINASFQARTASGGGIGGKADVRLLRIRYDKDRNPEETVVEEWNPEVGDDGSGKVRFTAGAPGQYRLAIKVTSPEGKTEEGAVVFSIGGKGGDGDFRFDDLELVPNKRNYAPGEQVKLQVRTDQKDGTVLLFVRPSNGVYLLPRILRLEGRSIESIIAITKKDMPNFFVEALTISGGRIYEEVREIIVPPEKRVVDVTVEPSKDAYKPGEEATVKVTATGVDGKPFAGTYVLAVYDRALEQISGGSNVPDIRSHFWKWRRRHNPNRFDSLAKGFHNLMKSGEKAMRAIGVFGHNVAEQAGVMRNDMAMDGGGVRMRKGAAMRSMSAGAVSLAAPMAMADGDMALAESAPMMAKASAGFLGGDAGGGGGGAAVAVPVVRTEFADTALWRAVLNPNADGVAEVTFKMPDNLTGWQFRSWAMGHGTQVGSGTALAVTAKDVMVRLQAPRFFIEKDEVVLSGVVHNKTDKAISVEAVLELDGGSLEPIDGKNKKLTVPAGGDVRADWRVKVVREGEAVVRMKALSQDDSDAMEMRFPVYVHGADRMVSWSGHLRPDVASIVHDVTVPADRRTETARLEIRYSPTLAGAMVDALPYMASFPYGCTEQTLNRFVPTVITQKVLLDMGLDLKTIRNKQANLNAQEIGDPQARAAQWKRWDHNPVFDEEEVAAMVAAGIERLTNMQNRDGGWGWFSGYREHSYPHTTATVVHGLQVARENDAKIDDAVIRRGIDWLKRHQKEQVRLLERGRRNPRPDRDYKLHADNLDAFVYLVLSDADVMDKNMRDYLYEDRLKLAVYGMALFGVAVDRQKQEAMAAMLQRNIEQYLKLDDENQTAYLDLRNSSYWWNWYGSEFEAHAWYLKLLARRAPKSDKAAWLAKYLLNNRKHSTYWNSTRDTALCVEALADYMRASEEDRPDMEVEILVDGKRVQTTKITADTMFTTPGTFVLTGKGVTSGKHKIEIRRTGKGPLYCNSYFSYFSLEDYIPKAGLEVKVERAFYKLIPEKKTIKVAGSHGQAGDQRVEKYRREKIADLAMLKSGDLVEVEFIVESKNDYEYIIVEDAKASGFETVDVLSGYNGNEMGAYMEFRDEKVAMFLRTLPRGRHSVSYRTRAEIPGKFSALPAQIRAMYAPELRGNSNEFKVQIED